MNAIDLMNGDWKDQLEDRFDDDTDWTECWEIATLELRVALGEGGYHWSDNTARISFDAPWRDEPYDLSTFRTRIHLDNGWQLSVVSGRTLYTVPARPYEIMALTPQGDLVGNFEDFDEDFENDPWGYQDLEQAMAILKRVAAL